ncbi:ADP-ribose pyrophosphatase, mitochondrial [Anticarsia gemmatalis]|uniref:ADP-ribose pyrophosphatase, mitochondrial n=1 Tax=Anticarsia gemmatalis TaxID=129554 RepID=UPI003F772A73
MTPKIIIFIFFFCIILMVRSSLVMLITTHFKCRGGLYPRSNVERFPVPDDKVSWSTEFSEYKPVKYTSPHINGQPWADPDIENPSFKPHFNSVDGKVSRVSYMGNYKIVNQYPLNPIGRTGVTGRGVLGRWGPNHAADPIVTSWKRLENGEIEHDKANKPILQFVAIKRGDTGEWALPGGMVDPGEKVTATAVREFMEEATNSDTMSEDEKKAWLDKFVKFFEGGDVVYQGYIDDHRNTDNAWMESAAYNFHDNNGSIVGGMRLHAGSDAAGVRWVDITPELKLYASHKEIVTDVYNKLLTKYSQTS